MIFRGALRSPEMAGSMATAVIAQLVLVASGVVIARALGPEDRGTLGLVVLLFAVSAQLGSLGVPAAVTYWTAKGADPRALLRSLREFRVLQNGVALAVHGFLIFAVLEPRSPSGFLWIGLVSLMATAASLSFMYGLAVLQGLGRFRAFNSLRILNPTLYMAGVVGLWASGTATLVPITLAIIGASAVAAVATWAVIYRGAPTAFQADGVPTRRMVSFGVRSLAGSAPPLETFRLDQLLVGLLLSPVALGYFIVALAFTNLTRFIGQSIGMVTYPRVAAAAGAEQIRIIRRDVGLGVAAAGGLTLALTLAVPWLLPFFFGSEFAPAQTTAQILILATFFASVRRILVDGTRGLGRPNWGAAAELLTLIALPVGVIITRYTDSLVAVAAVLAGANVISLLFLGLRLVRFGRDSVSAVELAAGKAGRPPAPLPGDAISQVSA